MSRRSLSIIHPGGRFRFLQFVSGFLIVIGPLTRPAVLANAVMLVITSYYHMNHPFGYALLTSEGFAVLKKNAYCLTTQCPLPS